jgi:hypothetical protein
MYPCVRYRTSHVNVVRLPSDDEIQDAHEFHFVSEMQLVSLEQHDFIIFKPAMNQVYAHLRQWTTVLEGPQNVRWYTSCTHCIYTLATLTSSSAKIHSLLRRHHTYKCHQTSSQPFPMKQTNPCDLPVIIKKGFRRSTIGTCRDPLMHDIFTPVPSPQPRTPARFPWVRAERCTDD